MLLNLVLNAGDAIPREGGRVVLRAARSGEDRVKIEVEDNGPGVAKEIRGRLFEPFATTKEVGEGTGLGLSIAQQLMHENGGRIEVASMEHAGTTFTLIIPAAEPSIPGTDGARREQR